MTQLDASQIAAATIEPAARQIVIAGPGAGKSHVVGALATNLVETHEVFPEEVLLISFSNAAVAVVRDRTGHVEDEGGTVRTSTIDSLAAIIRREAEEGDVEFAGYEEGIRRATALLSTDQELSIDEIRHIVIDEAQDVVDVRAQFVLALMGRLAQHDVGFTLLGDPMQALYDFQDDEDDPTTLSSQEFLDQAEREFGATRRVLDGEYRTRTAEARMAAEQRAELQEADPYTQVLRLRRAYSDLPPLGQMDEYAADDIRNWAGTTALLCDTNARAALVAAQAARHRLPVELAAGVLDRGLPDWVARILQPLGARVSRDEFFAAAATTGVEVQPEHWVGLLNVAGARKDLDVSQLVERLPTRGNNVLLRRQPRSQVVASTVHRSKGLEFDNVVLVNPDQWGAHPKDRDEATSRRLFVALTRGRSRVSTLDGVSTREWRTVRGEFGHRTWFKHRGRGWVGVIIEAADARALGPVDYDLTDMVGQAVDWERSEDHVDAEGLTAPSWVASVDGVPVAKTGWAFGRRIQRREGGPIPQLSGGRIEGLETVHATAPVPAGTPQLWLGARVTGPLDLDWKGNR